MNYELKGFEKKRGKKGARSVLALEKKPVLDQSGSLLVNLFENKFVMWRIKRFGCYVSGKFNDFSWSESVLRAPAVHGVSS